MKRAKRLTVKMNFRHQILVGLAFTILFSALPVHANPMERDPLQLYGKEIIFDVLRNGEKSGTHRVTFKRNGKNFEVSVNFNLSISFLSLKVYEFSYKSFALWTNDALRKIEAQTDDNGEKTYVTAKASEAGFSVRTPQKTYQVNSNLFPTNHWNSLVLKQKQVLNTITGLINEVSIRDNGFEKVSTERGMINATKYTYTGQLETTVWYDQQGRWVKMEFSGKDGSTITYKCKKCQAS